MNRDLWLVFAVVVIAMQFVVFAMAMRDLAMRIDTLEKAQLAAEEKGRP